MTRDLEPLRAVFALEVHKLSGPDIFEGLRLRLRLRLPVLLLALRLLLLLLAFPLSPAQSQQQRKIRHEERAPKQIPRYVLSWVRIARQHHLEQNKTPPPRETIRERSDIAFHARCLLHSRSYTNRHRRRLDMASLQSKR